MARMWIVVGDITSSGGRVISSTSTTYIDDLQVARVNDKATCPSHNGVFPIVDGDPTTIIDGQQVALHGSKLACGCTVLSVQQIRVFLDTGSGRAATPASASASGRSHTTTKAAPSQTAFAGSEIAVAAPPAAAAAEQSQHSPQCWIADHDKEVAAQSNRYAETFDVNGRSHNYVSPIGFSLKLPTQTGTNAVVEVKIKAVAKSGVFAADMVNAKSLMAAGVAKYWNNQLSLRMTDEPCETKAMPIEYLVAWVESGQHYTMNVHSVYPREGVTGKVIDVSNSTTPWIYAHEFGHCVGEPDEYSYTADIETVKYYKPDGTLDSSAISAPPIKPASDPSATIMSSHGNTTVLPRHGWSVAREAQALLSTKIGRPVTCAVV